MISAALQQLYNEHDAILSAIDRLTTILATGDLALSEKDIRELIDFFREYGDVFHHQKEEGLLFPTLSALNPGIESIIGSLSDHHEQFRDALAMASENIERSHWTDAASILHQYASDLADHISAENDELFVSADELLSDDEKERLYFQFEDRDRELGNERKRKLEASVLS